MGRKWLLGITKLEVPDNEVSSHTEKSRIADRKGGQARYKLLTPALALVLLTGTALAAILCSGECTGTNMDDRLIGGTPDDSIYSRTGNDRARGGAGKNFIEGRRATTSSPGRRTTT